MLRDFATHICCNKNSLMLVSVGFYILALFAVLSNNLLLVSLILTFGLVLALIKNIFPLKYVIVWALLFYFGVLNTSFRLKDVDDLLNIAPYKSTIYGQIISIPQGKTKDKIRFFFKVNKIEYDGFQKEFDNEKTLVTLNTDEKLKIYDSYKISGMLSTPFKAGNPSQFDYGNYLRNFDTYSVFYGKEFEKFASKISAKEKFLQGVNDYREKIIGIHSKYLASPNLDILGGIVFGDDAVAPPENIRQSFINSGLLHILAASGMNVAFIFSFFYFFLSLFKTPYKINISFCILMVLVYSLMTGLGPSVIRATCMLVFVLIGKLIDRDAHSISLLAFVALLMLIYNPMYINDVGFQLSFIVTFGLLLMSPYIIRSKNRIVNRILGTVFIPIIAQLWVIPIQIFYFNNISLYSVFANIMSVPILSVISFGGFVSSLIATITPDFIIQAFDFVLNPLLSFLVNISDFWGTLPHSICRTTHPNIFQILVYYSMLICFTVLLDKELREKYLKLVLRVLAVLIFALLMSIIPIRNKNLEIMAFDVGNADAFLLKTPENKYIMIDTAKSGYNGGKSQAEMMILKYMPDRGIKEVDSIIVTHFDNDHSGGAVDMMNGVKVNKIYVNSLEHDSNSAKSIYKTANDKNVRLILAENNQVVENNNGLKLTNLISKDSLELDDNEASVITLLEYKDFKMLFCGDAGVETLNKLKDNIPPNINVLKVGHHGAIGVMNKSFANYLKPKYSIISTGQNKFGHPSCYTLEILKNSKILRTDVNNSIKIVVNKNGYKVYCYDIKLRRYKRWEKS